MKLNLIFIQSNKEFSENDQKKISSLVRRVFDDASKKLAIKTLVSVTFYRNGKKNGGYTQAKDWIQATIPNGEIDFADLESMFYHEFHHIARGYNGYMKNIYLLDTVFAEGLATDFELENSKPDRKMTHHKYNAPLIKKWLPEMKKELHSTTYDYDSWFHGDGKPRQLGYRIGKYLVDQIRKNHPELTQKNLARMDAKKLLKLSDIRF